MLPGDHVHIFCDVSFTTRVEPFRVRDSSRPYGLGSCKNHCSIEVNIMYAQQGGKNSLNNSIDFFEYTL